MVQEVRHISPSLNIAEGLTRTIETKEALQRLLRTGRYHIPGGFPVLRTLRSSFKRPTDFNNTKQLQKKQTTTGMKEADPQPFQVLSEVLQREEEPKDQEHRGMTCQRNQATGKREAIHFEANEERKSPENMDLPQNENTSEHQTPENNNEENEEIEHNAEKKDPTIDEYHNIKEKREDDDTEPRSLSENSHAKQPTNH